MRNVVILAGWHTSAKIISVYVENKCAGMVHVHMVFVVLDRAMHLAVIVMEAVGQIILEATGMKQKDCLHGIMAKK